jgi:hypothetical protein
MGDAVSVAHGSNTGCQLAGRAHKGLMP